MKDAWREVMANHQGIFAIDQPEGFVKTAQRRLGGLKKCSVGNALSLPVQDSSKQPLSEHDCS
ncbi:MAG: hypothetical protein WBO37_14060 [Gammaproteobacteria bacterium]